MYRIELTNEELKNLQEKDAAISATLKEDEYNLRLKSERLHTERNMLELTLSTVETRAKQLIFNVSCFGYQYNDAQTMEENFQQVGETHHNYLVHKGFKW